MWLVWAVHSPAWFVVTLNMISVAVVVVSRCCSWSVRWLVYGKRDGRILLVWYIWLLQKQKPLLSICQLERKCYYKLLLDTADYKLKMNSLLHEFGSIEDSLLHTTYLNKTCSKIWKSHTDYTCRNKSLQERTVQLQNLLDFWRFTNPTHCSDQISHTKSSKIHHANITNTQWEGEILYQKLHTFCWHPEEYHNQ